MLSPGVLQMLDQVRSEFGVEVEIVDANLAAAWTPDGERAMRVLAGPELRSAGAGVLREGRASEVTIDDRTYRLVPLRSHGSVLPMALLAMRVVARHGGAEADVEPWVEVLRGAIEADLSSREDIDSERQQARAVRGVLKFVTHLAAAKSEREIADAALQAAAIWFDADARVYRRRPGGDFVLAASLPGAVVPPDTRVVSELALGLSTPFVRIAPLAGVANGREAVVVPLASAAQADWVLVIIGAVPQEADVTLEALGRVLGVQMERLALVRRDEARARFEALLVRSERGDVAGVRPSELVAIDLLRELVSRTRAESAALWIRHGDAVRRMAAVGTAAGATERVPGDAGDAGATRQVRTVDLGGGRASTLELRAAADSPLDADATAILDACVSVLTSWLPAAARPEGQASAVLLPSAVAGFVRRIEEELARAKRFDRNLSLVVVDAGARPWPQETTDRLVDVLRAELRGSDVLGLVGDRRVVVLLIETHQSAVGPVVRRLRERLGRAIAELQVPALVLGQAAYSNDCSTADALLTQAAVNAETIRVPA